MVCELSLCFHIIQVEKSHVELEMPRNTRLITLIRRSQTTRDCILSQGHSLR